MQQRIATFCVSDRHVEKSVHSCGCASKAGTFHQRITHPIQRRRNDVGVCLCHHHLANLSAGPSPKLCDLGIRRWVVVLWPHAHRRSKCIRPFTSHSQCLQNTPIVVLWESCCNINSVISWLFEKVTVHCMWHPLDSRRLIFFDHKYSCSNFSFEPTS